MGNKFLKREMLKTVTLNKWEEFVLLIGLKSICFDILREVQHEEVSIVFYFSSSLSLESFSLLFTGFDGKY